MPQTAAWTSRSAAAQAAHRPVIVMCERSTVKPRPASSAPAIASASRARISQDAPHGPAVEVAVLLGREDVELLAPVDAVVVADVAEVLEHVERPIDGRGRRRRIDRPAALDELGAGDVAVGPAQDVDERAPLRRPAQALRMQALADLLPGSLIGTVARHRGEV